MRLVLILTILGAVLGLIFAPLPTLAKVTSDVLLPPDVTSPHATDPNNLAESSGQSPLAAQPQLPTVSPPSVPLMSTPSSNLVPGLIGLPKTSVIKIPSPSTGTSTKNSPFILKFNLTSKTVWTPYEKNVVTQRFNIKPEDTVSLCTQMYSGSVLTELGLFKFSAPQGSSSRIGYNGTITSLMVSKFAICSVHDLPKNAGLVYQIADRYQIMLSTFTCKPSPKEPFQSVQFVIGSDAQEHCQYQN